MFRCAVVFASLFIITLPFPYNILPDPGRLTHPLFEALAQWTAGTLLGIDPPYTAAIVSDSTGMYVHTFNLLLLSAVISLAWSILAERRRDTSRIPQPHQQNHTQRYHNLWYWFSAAMSYYLALQLFKYGFNKAFKHQFYLPEPNTLCTPLGHLTRDILYWSAIGSSYSYTVITGILEVLPAMLLLFRRTRPLGAIGAVVVTAHIVAINFGFDISVKLYSCFLLFLCLVVAWPALGKLFRLFIRQETVEAREHYPRLDSRKKILVYSMAKALVIGVILLEALFPYFEANNFNDDTAPRPFLHGAYEVQTFISNGDTVPPLLTRADRLRRVFVHRRGYFITQTMNDAMRDYRLVYDRTNAQLILDRDTTRAGMLAYTFDARAGLLTLRGRLERDSIELTARRVDLRTLPLLGVSFHWTIDGYR